MATFPSVPGSFPSDPADARVGTIVGGKWRLDRVLGRGGMATVYAATHRNRSRVAIKILHAHHHGEIVERFAKEGYLGNVVEHPGAARTLDDGVTDDGAPFLVMELLEGESLHQRLERTGPLPLEEACYVAHQVLDVLAVAHTCQLVHRDVKPENVFLLRNGGVKLLDFGIARERIFAETPGTISGFILGSPGFMAAEQALGHVQEIDARTDLWAVGATLFVAITGRDLRTGRTPEEKLLAAMQPCPAAQTLAPNIPDSVAAVLDRALAFDRKSRFSSAREMQSALQVAFAHAGHPPKRMSVSSFSPAVSVTQAHAPAPQANRALRGAAAAVAILVVVLSLVGLSNRRSEAPAPASFLPPVPQAQPGPSAPVTIPSAAAPLDIDDTKDAGAPVRKAAPPAPVAPAHVSREPLRAPVTPPPAVREPARVPPRSPAPAATEKRAVDPLGSGRF